MSWTHDRIKTLMRLWNDGLSASEIATELGGVTRNAILGKVHRLGLPGRAKSRSPQTVFHQKAAAAHAVFGSPSGDGQRKHSPIRKAQTRAGDCLALDHGTRDDRERFKEEVSEPVSYAKPVTILDVRQDQCRYPLDRCNDHGDPLFCGKKCVPNTSWCIEHQRIVYGGGAPSEKSAIADARCVADGEAV